jgi:hypothetical protein
MPHSNTFKNAQVYKKNKMKVMECQERDSHENFLKGYIYLLLKKNLRYGSIKNDVYIIQ